MQVAGNPYTTYSTSAATGYGATTGYTGATTGYTTGATTLGATAGYATGASPYATGASYTTGVNAGYTTGATTGYTTASYNNTGATTAYTTGATRQYSGAATYAEPITYAATGATAYTGAQPTQYSGAAYTVAQPTQYSGAAYTQPAGATARAATAYTGATTGLASVRSYEPVIERVGATYVEPVIERYAATGSSISVQPAVTYAAPAAVTPTYFEPAGISYAEPVINVNINRSAPAQQDLKAAGRVVGERPISREELAASGNLGEAPGEAYTNAYNVTGGISGLNAGVSAYGAMGSPMMATRMEASPAVIGDYGGRYAETYPVYAETVPMYAETLPMAPVGGGVTMIG